MPARLVCLAAIAALVAVGAPTATGAAEPSSTAVPSVATYVVGGVSTREDRTAVARTGAAVEEVDAGSVVVRALPAEADAIRALGFPVSAVASRDFPVADAGFHDYAETVAEIDAVVAAHPDIAARFSIGRSYRGREIWAVKLSDHVARDEAEPEVLYDSLHHGREHLTVEEALAILHTYADGYGSDPRTTAIVDGREIFVLFMVNPDGGEYDVATGTYRFWRKNRQPTGVDGAVGTDLNRNYGYRWGCCGGSSGNPGSDTYRGPAPFSAPETAAYRDFVDGRVVGGVQQLRTNVTFHTYSELVLYPYGYTFADVPSDMTADDHAVFVRMARDMARSTCMAPWGCYTAEQASELYITDGTSDDWLYGEHGVFTLAVEMFPDGGSGEGFYPDDEDIAPQTARVRELVLYAAEHADCPFAAAGLAAGYCPRVAGVSPRRGAPGATVTITGSGFTGAVGVGFDGVPAAFTVVDDATVTAVVPPGARTGLVTVDRERGSGASGRPFRVLARSGA